MGTRSQKAELIETVAQRLRDAPLGIVTGFTGLSVRDMQVLRLRLREVGAVIRVVKITLARRAVSDAGFDALMPYLDGQTALTLSGDDLAGAARVLRGFAREFPSVEIRGGVLHGEKIEPAHIERMADLPGLDELRGILVWSLESPITGFVNTLDGLVPGLIFALQGRVQQLQNAEAQGGS